MKRKKKYLLSHGGVDYLTDSEGNHGGLSSARLGLRNNISAIDDGHHCSLLNSRWLLESILVNSSKEVVADAHLIKTGHNFHSLTCFKY